LEECGLVGISNLKKHCCYQLANSTYS